jgi:hypothetical protein
MSAVPRRIVTGHDASGRSVVLSDGPNPKTLDIGTAAFHEVWIADQVPAAIDGSETRVGVGDAVVRRGTNHAWANRSGRPVRMVFVLIDGVIGDELRAAAGPLQLIDQALE